MTSPVFSISMLVAASSADVQVVASASCILVDVQSWHFDTAGQSRRNHACAGLSVSESRRLHALLGKAIAIAAGAETRQGQMQLAARRSPLRNSANSCACPSTVPATAIVGKRLCRDCNKESRAGRSPVTWHNRVREHPTKPAGPRNDGDI